MRYWKRPTVSGRDIQTLILIGIVAVAVLGTLAGADIQLSRGITGGGGGFYAPWEGARRFIYQHTSPYDTEVRKLAEDAAYGRPAQAGERPYAVSIPFFVLLVYFPLAILSDPLPQQGALVFLNTFSNPATARGVWMFIDEAALVGAASLSLRMIEWQPNRLFRIAYALLSLFGFYSVISLLEGGPAILLGLLYPAVLFAYANEQDELSGALLVLCLFAWEIGLLFVMLLLWKILYDRRWRVLAGFGMMLALLLIVSFMIYPGWLFPFFASTLAVARASFGITSAQVLLRLSPAYGARAAQAMTVLLLILLLYEWSATRHAEPRRFIWAGCLTLAVTPLIGLRTELGNLVVLLPSLALVFAGIANRWRSGYWLAGLLLLQTFLLPWGWFVRWYSLGDQRAYDYLVLFLPVFTIVGLYWTRWWFLRPPRTWFEHVRTSLGAAGRVEGPKRALGSILRIWP